MTRIEWTDQTWNPVTGCTKVSPGCQHCYAERMATRLAGRAGYPADDPFTVTLHANRLDEPLRWRKPRRVFVCSMADLFHRDVPAEFIAGVWTTLRHADQHTYQVLTKRPQRMVDVVSRIAWRSPTAEQCARGYSGWVAYLWPEGTGTKNQASCGGPDILPNVWLGTSIESDRYVWRADHLRSAPAAVRFLSLEPLLGPLPSLNLTGIDWVIVGGESGPGARPMHPGWVRDLRDRCVDAGVPFFFKQWGEWAPAGSMYDTTDRTHLVLPDGTDRGIPWSGWRLDRPEAEPMRRFGKRQAGRTLDGRTWDQLPEAVTP